MDCTTCALGSPHTGKADTPAQKFGQRRLLNVFPKQPTLCVTSMWQKTARKIEGHTQKNMQLLPNTFGQEN
jgi:hypothetical protein